MKFGWFVNEFLSEHNAPRVLAKTIFFFDSKSIIIKLHSLMDNISHKEQ